MDALLVSQHGEMPRMHCLPRPEPGPGEVLVAVEAAGLNFADLLMIKGTYQETPELPFVPGLELAGRIVALGSDVRDWTVGDRVAAETRGGALADFATLPADRLWRLPDAMSATVAAGFQVAYGTSHLALVRRAALAKGETLVVLGAAGGVGLTAVEIGKALGARVIAVARGAEKQAIARAAGADETLDAQTDDLRDALKALGGADVVYDAVGGALGEAAFRALRPEGRFLVIGFASGDVPALKLNHALVKNVSLIGVYWGGYGAFAPAARTQTMQALADWHAKGRISPQIEVVQGLDHAVPALERLRRRDTTGKLVVRIGGPNTGLAPAEAP